MIFVLVFFGFNTNIAKAQDSEELKITGSLLTDQRLLLKENNDWAWNENRLTLNFEKKISGNSKFYSEVWLRNIGLPNFTNSTDLYNKGILDPYNLEVREAYIEMYGFLSKKLDLKIGRQRIAWGKADKLNPTDNLNPYDMEDLYDFGRHRGSDAISFNYYFNSDYSLQGVFIPFFAPANLPIGMFSNSLTPVMSLPQGAVLKGYTDNLIMPKFNISESSTAGLKFDGRVKTVDFSLSYVWGRDGLPLAIENTFIPVDTLGGVFIQSTLDFTRYHIFGADISTDIAGIGVWAEAAVFLPENDMIMRNDLSNIYPLANPNVFDSTVLNKTKPFTKFVVGADYHFSNGSYLNAQFLHGFIHERGNESLNDYLFLRYEKSFFNDKLKISPLSGAFIISNWDKVNENFAFIYMPEISYKATVNAEITISTIFSNGKGDNLFVGLKDYNMLIFKCKYIF